MLTNIGMRRVCRISQSDLGSTTKWGYIGVMNSVTPEAAAKQDLLFPLCSQKDQISWIVSGKLFLPGLTFMGK